MRNLLKTGTTPKYLEQIKPSHHARSITTSAKNSAESGGSGGRGVKMFLRHALRFAAFTPLAKLGGIGTI
jgi:hypothetical protein